MTVELTLVEIIVGALALTSCGQRALKWAWAHRALVRALFDTLERWTKVGSVDAESIKHEIGATTELARGPMRRQAELLAAWAESRNGGGQTSTKRENRSRRQKAGDVVKGIARWLPVVGALLD